jgi:hypothetical protein
MSLRFTEIGVNDFNLQNAPITFEGSTDTVTECFCCGKQNLKRTAVLKDNDGNYSFYGATCAFNALNVWSKSLNYQSKVKQSIKRKFEFPTPDIEVTIGNREFKLTSEGLSYVKKDDQWVSDVNKVTLKLDLHYEIDTNRVHLIENINELLEWMDKHVSSFKFPF